MKENKENKEIENGLKEDTTRYIPCNLRSKYLPNLLVKLGEAEDNTTARKMIRNEGVLVNGEMVRTPSVEMKKKHTYKIKLPKVAYEITIL